MDASTYLPLFLAEAAEHLQEMGLAVVRLESGSDDAAVLDGLFRVAHSFKGSSAAMGFGGIAALTHRMEDVLELLRRRRGGVGPDVIDALLSCLDALAAAVERIARDGVERLDPTVPMARLDALVRRGGGSDRERPAAGADADAEATPARATPAAGEPPVPSLATVRIEAERLDLLVSAMNDLVAHRTRLEALVAETGRDDLDEAMRAVMRSSELVQAVVVQVRTVAIDTVFLRLPRLVRDLRDRLGKQVALELDGRGTELDRTVVDALADPLAHLVRNAMDHGLESPGERAARGKPETGRIVVRARLEGSDVLVSVADDGAGIVPARVAAHALTAGLLEPGDLVGLDPADAIELLFRPGFSTARRTTEISGRGVGLDAVRDAVRGLGGEVALRSVPGRGTTVEMRVPLALPIVPALVVGTDQRPDGPRYAVPIERIERIVPLAGAVVRASDAGEAVLGEDGDLPLVRAAALLGEAQDAGPAHAVVVRTPAGRVALGVARLVGRRELVTRPVPPALAGRPAVCGAAVLPEGDLALVVDCDVVGAASDRCAAS